MCLYLCIVSEWHLVDHVRLSSMIYYGVISMVFVCLCGKYEDVQDSSCRVRAGMECVSSQLYYLRPAAEILVLWIWPPSGLTFEPCSWKTKYVHSLLIADMEIGNVTNRNKTREE